MGKQEVNAGLWWGDMMKREHLEDLCVDGNTILKWIFKKWIGETLG
jgi:hypothetical protein